MDTLTEDAQRWLVSRFARFLAQHGEEIGRPDLILPTGEFFPDEFTRDPEGVMRVAKRVLSYAPVSDELELQLGFLEPEDGNGKSGGCGSGACGTGGKAAGVVGGDAIETDTGYGITLGIGDAGNPVLLTAALARGTGAIVLSEAGEQVDADERSAMSELAASVVGFGVLLTSGAYVYGKSCGGVHMRQATHLSVEEHATLLCLFCRVHNHKPSVARTHLETTQREAFDTALRWVDSNPHIIDALRAHPETLVDGVFSIEQEKGIFARLFQKRGPKPDEIAVPKKKAEPRSEAERKRLAEAKALVDEAFHTRS
jgi:hypothetical protein